MCLDQASAFFFLSFFLRFYLFILERHTERGRDTGRGISRLLAGSQMQNSIPDHRIRPWAKGRCSTAKPPRHPNDLSFLMSCLPIPAPVTVLVSLLFLVVREPLLQIWFRTPMEPFILHSGSQLKWGTTPQLSYLYPLPSRLSLFLNMWGLKWSCHIQEMEMGKFLFKSFS